LTTASALMEGHIDQMILEWNAAHRTPLKRIRCRHKAAQCLRLLGFKPENEDDQEADFIVDLVDWKQAKRGN